MRNNAPLTSADVSGMSVHFGGGYLIGTFQKSYSLTFDETNWYDVDLGRVQGLSFGAAASPHMPVSGAWRVGVGYTFNLSRIGRWFNGLGR